MELAGPVTAGHVIGMSCGAIPNRRCVRPAVTARFERPAQAGLQWPWVCARQGWALRMAGPLPRWAGGCDRSATEVRLDRAARSGVGKPSVGHTERYRQTQRCIWQSVARIGIDRRCIPAVGRAKQYRQTWSVHRAVDRTKRYRHIPCRSHEAVSTHTLLVARSSIDRQYTYVVSRTKLYRHTCCRLNLVAYAARPRGEEGI